MSPRASKPAATTATTTATPTATTPVSRASARRASVRTLCIASLAAGLPVACQTPFADRSSAIPSQDALSARIDQAMAGSTDRQLAGLGAQTAPAVATTETAVDRMLAARRSELDAIGPQSRELGKTVSGVVPLTAEAPRRVMLTVQEAIAAAVRNNLDAETARLEQAITDTDLTRAEAAFDWVVGAGAGYERNDQPSVGILFPGSGGTTVIPNVTNQRNWSFGPSIGKALTSGGQFSVSGSTGQINNTEDGVYTPDPAWTSAVSLGLTQPLLRGFGEDVALAQVRLAGNDDRLATEALRARLLSVVAQTQQAYWALVSARARLVSAEWLVSVGEEVRDILAKRREFDATVAQYANAVATVEQRKALVIEARRRLSEAGNALKAIVNDPSLPVGGEIDVVPSDVPSDAAFEANLRQSLEQAFANAPAIRQALIGIDSASIGVTVAENGTLPQLDLSTNVTWFGLQDDFGDSMSEIGEGDFINYAAGLQFSQALGNRAADATYRQARLRRSQAFVAYEQAVQGSVLAVKNALTDCVAYRQLVEQNRTYRLAQAENLRALLVDEKTNAALTPEFLQLKFQLQNGLALAEDAYFASLVGYQSAIAALQQATGTGLDANRIEFTPAK
jgi:outer membrane protein TolC